MGVWIDGESNIAIEHRGLHDDEHRLTNHTAFSEVPVRCGPVV